jgi:hypothetical protein
MWLNDSESYAAVATSRVSHAREVNDDDLEKNRYTGPPGRGLSEGPTTPPHKNICCCKDPQSEPVGQGPY